MISFAGLASRLGLMFTFCALMATASAADSPPGATVSGEPLDPSQIGAQEVVTFEQILAEDRAAPPVKVDPHERNGANGVWSVPTPGGMGSPSSGNKHVVNKWGDAGMGIGFPRRADVRGAYFAAQGSLEASALLVQVVGYRQGVEVGRSDFLADLSAVPKWVDFGLVDVDRIRIEACAKSSAGAWYGMDDLTYAWHGAEATDPDGPVNVLDFEDVPYKTVLTGSGYAGLVWESGSGEFGLDAGMPPPQTVTPRVPEFAPYSPEPIVETGSGFTLDLKQTFRGIRRGEANTTFPPDTCGAIGPNHFMETINFSVAIFRKSDGVRVQTVSLSSLIPGTGGDPRVLFDPHSQRWIVVGSDFSSRLQLSVSTTSDPTGPWFRTNFIVNGGTDTGTWPDHPTLGLDANGIYIGFFPVGRGYTLVAINKAPLVAPAPSLGAVTFFRDLPFEGTAQPTLTYGTPAGEYVISTRGQTGSQLRLRRINPPLTSPTMTELGFITVTSFTFAPDAPQQGPGSIPPLDTVDTRLINATYRNGRIWASHTINANGRAAARWYEVRPDNLTVVQQGTIAGNPHHYFFPSISVNDLGDAVIGFTGSHAGQFAAAYYSGRRAGDPLGFMSAPVQYVAGLSTVNNIDGVGRNRWGDYSLTTVDPSSNRVFWTIQEYADTSGLWSTQVAELSYDDCNNNNIPDECDVDCAACGGAPGCGQSTDCNNNAIPDECEPDCNNNGTPDPCDISTGASPDCNANGVPDECDLSTGASLDCNNNQVPDECDIAPGGVDTDCNNNTIPDGCDLAGGLLSDCNNNNIADLCEAQNGTSTDCDQDGVLDACELAAGTAQDCNHNQIPDDCDIARLFEAPSGQLSPIGDGSPQSFTLAGAPESLSDVFLDLTASADLGSLSEILTISLNGTQVGTAFQAAQDCAVPPNEARITVARALFNSLVNAGAGDATVDISASPSVSAAQCGGANFVTVAIRYQDGVAGSADTDGDGVPDECNNPMLLGDMNCDGTVTVSDIGGFVLALTDPAAYALQFPGCNIQLADMNQDGSVTVSDIGAFVQVLTG